MICPPPGPDRVKAINEIFRHVKQSSNQLTKQSFIDKISMRLWVKLSDFTWLKNNGDVLSQLWKKILRTKIIMSEEINTIDW